MTNRIFAYTDESGNSGHNILDHDQPFFYTGTLMTHIDLDLVSDKTISNCLNRINSQPGEKKMFTELHGSELGYRRIELIAHRLHNLIIKYDCRFLFTRVEKRHVARLKFYDTVFDSGLNHAVSPVHYSNRFLRLLDASAFAYCLGDDGAYQFWDVYGNSDLDGFCKLLQELLSSVEQKIYDPRARQLLTDAIGWAIKYPQELFFKEKHDLNAPNMVAFSLLVGNLGLMLDETDMHVVRFIHDQQNQFAKSMKKVYEINTRLALPIAPFSWAQNIIEIDAYNGPLEFSSSTTSRGLQIVDVALWLMIKNPLLPPEKLYRCRSLIKEIFKRSSIAEFSQAQLLAEVAESSKQLEAIPLSEETVIKAKALFQQFENIRQERMLKTP